MSVMAVEPPSAVYPFDIDSRTPGGVRVHERVVAKVVRETSAVAIGVSRDHVDVEVTEWGGGLGVRIAAKLPVPDLSDLAALEAAVPVLERVHELQAGLAEELATLTGRVIHRVSFTVTGAVIPKRKRVR
ncbi:NTP pyrophosphohydrolase [Leucobacter chromiireducens]|nr:NTP pyrophosphohydrolase [Leucobacter chromiireducens]